MHPEAGQLRRWTNPDHPRDRGKVFMILGVKTEWDSGISMPAGDFDLCWDFIMDGVLEWHYDDVIGRYSEVVGGDG